MPFFLKNYFIQFLIVSLLMSAILHFMGRIFWCSCGEFYLWASEVHSSHNSQHLFDAYSFSHFQHGVVFYAVLRLLSLPYFFIALIIEAAWEILENSSLIIERYRAATFSLNYYGDSIANSIGDLASCTLGYYLTAKLPIRTSILLYLLIELTMIALIKDSLTLNVIMLIYPLDFIKAWQSA